MMILPLLLVVGAVAYARGWRPEFLAKLTQTGQGPLDILDARYARGEITRDEYQQARTALQV